MQHDNNIIVVDNDTVIVVGIDNIFVQHQQEEMERCSYCLLYKSGWAWNWLKIEY